MSLHSIFSVMVLRACRQCLSIIGLWPIKSRPLPGTFCVSALYLHSNAASYKCVLHFYGNTNLADPTRTRKQRLVRSFVTQIKPGKTIPLDKALAASHTYKLQIHRCRTLNKVLHQATIANLVKIPVKTLAKANACICRGGRQHIMFVIY